MLFAYTFSKWLFAVERYIYVKRLYDNCKKLFAELSRLVKCIDIVVL